MTDVATPQSTESAQVTEQGRKPRTRATWLHWLEKYALVVLLVATFIFFSVAPATSSHFLTTANIQSVLGNQAILGVLAVGSLAPMICRNFDLSVGAIACVTQIATGAAMSKYGLPAPVAVLIGLALGALIGYINGLVVTRFRVNAIITTLGVGAILGGVAQAYTGGVTIVTGISPSLVDFGRTLLVGVPSVTIVLIIVAALSIYVFDHVPFGRNLNFVGSNPVAAKLVGLNVDRLVRSSFMISGLAAGLAGVLLVARNGTADPTAGLGFTLPAVAAAALGATAIRPGRFNVIGTLVAVLYLGFGVAGLILYGVPYWINDVFFGSALVIAVAASALLGNYRVTSRT
jgi:ribose transport system permease protein